MNKKEQDLNLQTPQEANTTKHINFREVEETDSANQGSDTSGSEEESPTKKAWEELRNENSSNSKNDSKEERR